MGAKSRIRAYYEALREGDPLYSYFAPDTEVVKFGSSETLAGYEEIEAGLERQTRSTTDWTVESRDLRGTERDRHAWFTDRVFLAWTDTDRQIRYEFDTRWSGTLERRPRASDTKSRSAGAADDETESAEGPGDWRFVGMHVSTAGDL